MQFVTQNPAERSLNTGDWQEHDLAALNTFYSPLPNKATPLAFVQPELLGLWRQQSDGKVRGKVESGENAIVRDLLFPHKLQPLYTTLCLFWKEEALALEEPHFISQRAKSTLEAGAALKTSASPLQMPVEVNYLYSGEVAGKPSCLHWDNILLLFRKASSTSACLNPVRLEHIHKVKHMLKSFPETDTCEETHISWNMGSTLSFIPSFPPRISGVWNAKNPSKLPRRSLFNLCMQQL